MIGQSAIQGLLPTVCRITKLKNCHCVKQTTYLPPSSAEVEKDGVVARRLIRLHSVVLN